MKEYPIAAKRAGAIIRHVCPICGDVTEYRYTEGDVARFVAMTGDNIKDCVCEDCAQATTGYTDDF